MSGAMHSISRLIRGTSLVQFLLCVERPAAAQNIGANHAKPAIRGLVSMGAFKFVGSGGDPVNTLEPLNAKPGIFGGMRPEILANGSDLT